MKKCQNPDIRSEGDIGDYDFLPVLVTGTQNTDPDTPLENVRPTDTEAHLSYDITNAAVQSEQEASAHMVRIPSSACPEPFPTGVREEPAKPCFLIMQEHIGGTRSSIPPRGSGLNGGSESSTPVNASILGDDALSSPDPHYQHDHQRASSVAEYSIHTAALERPSPTFPINHGALWGLQQEQHHDQVVPILEDSFDYNEAQFPIGVGSTGSQTHYNHPVFTIDGHAVMPAVDGQSDQSVEFWG